MFMMWWIYCVTNTKQTSENIYHIYLVTQKVLKSSRSKMVTLAHDVCDVHVPCSLYIKTCCQSLYRAFPTGGWRSPSTKQKLAHLPPPHQIFIPSHHSTQQKNKNVIFSCSHCSCTIFLLISLLFWNTDHANFDFNWCSVFTKCCFWLWKIFESSKSLVLRFSPPGKKNPPSSVHYFLTQKQENS